MVGAIITGTAIFGFGGWTWGLVLIAFFVSSTLLSHFRRADKTAMAEKFAKGERRDLAQTLANGGFGALLAVAVLLFIDLPGKPRLGNPLYAYLTLAYFGAIASANADTWATELGVLSRTPPRLITTGKPVAPGTSGGITWYGTVAALAGSAFIGDDCVRAHPRRCAGDDRCAPDERSTRGLDRQPGWPGRIPFRQLAGRHGTGHVLV